MNNDEENMNTISYSKILTVIFGNNSHVKEFTSESLENYITVSEIHFINNILYAVIYTYL